MTGAVAALAGGRGLSVTANTPVSGVGAPTNASTAVATGGTPPYGHSWQKISGDDLSPLSPISASTQFDGPVPGGESFTAFFKCVVTDALGRTGESNPVAATRSEF